MRQRSSLREAQSRDTTRLEAISDGVIAIAITLLIIEIKVPHLEEGHEGAGDLARALWDLWPSYVGYVVSFLTIGIIWINHHGIFKVFSHTDQRLMTINTIFLMMVAFIPFPTGVLAEYLGKEGERTAVVFYGGTFTLTAIAYYLLWSYPTRGWRLVRANAPQATIDAIERRFRPGSVIYLASTVVGYFFPRGMGLLATIAIVYLVPYLADRDGAEASDSPSTALPSRPVVCFT